MSRKTRKPQGKAIVKGATTNSPAPAGFDEVLALIEGTRSRVATAVNTALIDLYWRIGQYISRKIADEGWGQGTVAALAEYIRARRPNARGFSASNLWRMMQFYETYRGLSRLAPLVRVLSWTHNLLIMSRSKRDEEREFYLRLCVQERWSKRDNWNGSLPERYSSASHCLPQNSHHGCENCTPKPHLSLRTVIWSSFSIFPETIPKPISTMVSSQG